MEFHILCVFCVVGAKAIGSALSDDRPLTSNAQDARFVGPFHSFFFSEILYHE